jgi:RNA polymerase sigma-70 factor (ECF subfamily)
MDTSPALTQVYTSSYGRLVAQMLAMSGSRQEAEDAVQEAFVKAIGQGDRWPGIENPEAWLRTVALNHLRNRWRHLNVIRRLARPLPGPVVDVELTVDHVALVSALRRLEPRLREVVVLHYVADLTVTAVAAELDLPVGTVKWRLARARELLRPELTSIEETGHVRPS